MVSRRKVNKCLTTKRTNIHLPNRVSKCTSSKGTWKNSLSAPGLQGYFHDPASWIMILLSSHRHLLYTHPLHKTHWAVLFLTCPSSCVLFFLSFWSLSKSWDRRRGRMRWFLFLHCHHFLSLSLPPQQNKSQMIRLSFIILPFTATILKKSLHYSLNFHNCRRS